MRERYREDPDYFRRRSREAYRRNPEPAKARAKAQRQREAGEETRLLRETVPEPVPFRGDLSWMDRAACAGMDTDLFFRQTDVSPSARRACLRCPVRAECLGMALVPELHVMGVWGGTSQKQRLEMAQAKRREARAARDTAMTQERGTGTDG